MWVAVINNLPEMILGACWTYTAVWAGMRFERWRSSGRFLNRAKTGV